MTRSRRSTGLVCLALAMAGLAGCGSSSHSSTASKASSAQPAASSTASGQAPAARVSISGYAFHRTTLTVAPGAKVTFTNHDATAHTATSTGPGFDTGTIGPGRSATVTLRRPGTYTYYCQFHAFMRGTVVVS